MRPRYLVFLRDPAAPAIDGAGLADRLSLRLIDDRPDLLAFVTGDCRAYTLGGVRILGSVIPRFGPPRPIAEPELAAGEAVTEGAEARLLGRYYGGYVAILPAARGFRILRDPSGALPCYYAETPDGFIVASDVDLLLAAGLPTPAIDWRALLRFYYLRGLPMPETCLAGVEELLAGYALDVSSAVADQRMCWSPWDHVAEDEAPPGPARSEHLRRVAQASVGALTADYERLLVSVSGGLDSSIVTACLARSGRDVRCITMYTDDPAGDERFYARALCAHFGLPLVECAYRAELIDLDAPISPHLPRPIGRSLMQAYDQAHLELAEATQVQAFVTGNGGDNVFGFSQSGAALVDLYMAQGVSLALLRTWGDICRQTESSPFAVLRAAFRSRRLGYRWTPGPMFLDADMVAALAPGPAHQPWLNPPPGTGPAKAAHVAALLRVQQLLEPARSRYAPVITPLVSQPMLETCLAIPSWAWRAGGRDRAVARDAFAGQLPATVARRRTKGGPDGFAIAVMNRYRTGIRDRLLDGMLARHRVADRAAMEARFRSEDPFSAEETVRLLDLVDTEAWITTWQARAGATLNRPSRDAPAPKLPTV